MNASVDWGNTRVKAGLFEGEVLRDVVVLDGNTETGLAELEKFLGSTNLESLIWAASGAIGPDGMALMNSLNGREFTHSTAIGHRSEYRTTETLGLDRILNAEAAFYEFPGENTLIIDMGTCITYDLVNAQGVHLGGAISPGWVMRLRAMNAFTAGLPLVSHLPVDLIGDSTESALQSGAYNGMAREMQGTISVYEQRFDHLNVVVTGGDHLAFDLQAKKTIFARPNYTLQGLNAITIQNAL